MPERKFRVKMGVSPTAHMQYIRSVLPPPPPPGGGGLCKSSWMRSVCVFLIQEMTTRITGGQQKAATPPFVWSGAQAPKRVGSRSITMEFGGRCVTMAGTTAMLK